MVDVCLIGTGGMMPLKNRFLTSCLVEVQGRSVLIDCGEGTQIACQHADLKMSNVEAILFTHYHADHCSGLPGMLLELGQFGKNTPLDIYGPPRLEEIVTNITCICKHIPFEIRLHPLPLEKSEFEAGGLHITAMPMQHTSKCLGYNLTLFRKPIFNPKKAEELNIPLKYWKVLHSGKSVEVDGITYTTQMVTDGGRDPISVTYATDTVPNYNILELAWRSDLLICEGMYGTDDDIDDLHKKGHMSFSEAAKIARDAEAKELWLTHYSPALTNPKEFEYAAKRIFSNSHVCKDGRKKSI